MLQTEYIRSLNNNYERILLDKKPEEKRYQYCILSRGGIKGLLTCSLRYINGLAYLYYDISSKQNVTQIYDNRVINRKWMKDFFWSMKQIQLELARFLLDERNVLWYPQQIFQDLENNIFSFLYMPYYEGDNGFHQLLEYFVEHIDYEDEGLVECVYKMYEQFEKVGEAYLQEQIFTDAKILEIDRENERNAVEFKDQERRVTPGRSEVHMRSIQQPEENQWEAAQSAMAEQIAAEQNTAEQTKEKQIALEQIRTKQNLAEDWPANDAIADKREKKGILSIFDGRRKREKDKRDSYERALQLTMGGYSVAEETPYEEEEEWGRTIYIEEDALPKERVHRLCTQDGRMIIQLDKNSITIGKKKEEADLVLEDVSVSRMHARIIKEQDGMYLEDLNSTNGTFKNGLRMQPYEKRKLEEGDEIRFGKKDFVYY